MRVRWGLTPVVTVVVIAASATAARAASPCGSAGVFAQSGGAFTCTYTTLGEDTFSVPLWLSSVSVTAVGAPGGAGGPTNGGGTLGGAGGAGAVVSVPSFGVTSGSTVYVEVGGAGSAGGTGSTSPPPCPAGAGGSGGGGTGGVARCANGGGGGGGGESDLRLTPAASGGLTGGAGDPRLLVAGGGGGAGGGSLGSRSGGAGGSSGGSGAGGGGAGGGESCPGGANGSSGGTGQTGGPGGAGGVATGFGCGVPHAGEAGAVLTGGAGGDGNTANSAGGGGGGGGYYGGGGGVAVPGFGGAGGGGGSSFGTSGASFSTASASQSAQVVISWTETASASISSPADGAVYSRGQSVTSSFTCSDANGPGIATCTDQNGKASGSPVDTGTVGQHTFTVTATSGDGVSGTANATYTVVANPPKNVTPPAISGTPAAGRQLSCSSGTWSNSPTSFAYSWSRNGTLLLGATSSTYTVVKLDEGSALTCTVTATNPDGSGSVVSSGVAVPVPHVRGCPAATGRVSGHKLGPVRLGINRKQARRAFPHSSDRGNPSQDFFCLEPIGIRVGLASPKLLATVPTGMRAQFRGRVVWISTANPRYAIRGVRPGATLKAARRHLKLGRRIRIGANDWYLSPAGSVTAVLKVRRGEVQEVGIAVRSLTVTRRAQAIFMGSFG